MASVLMVIAVATLAAFMMAGLTVTHLRLLSRDKARTTATDLAESALGVAIASIRVSPTTVPPGGTMTYEVGPALHPGTFPDAPMGSIGVVTFDQTGTVPGLANPMPWSNSAILSNTTVTAGVYPVQVEEPLTPPDTTVAKHTVRLIGTGICGDERRSIMVVLYWPPFPDCIACSGKVNSAASLYVAGVVNPACPNVTASPNIAPGDILSNALAQPGISIAANSNIFGNVISGGTVAVGPNVNITGQIVENNQPLPALPYLNIESMITGVTALPCWVCCPWDKLKTISSMPGGTLAQGFYHCSGDMVVSGPLVLQNAVIAIDHGGSFTCTGGVSGYGAIIADGNPSTHVGIAVMGSSDLSSIGNATNRVALISGQDIYVGQTPGGGCGGSCTAASYFQGLVYTQGNFYASHVTLLGAFVANSTGPPCNPFSSPPPCAGQMTLDCVKMYQVPSYSTILVQEEMAKCGPPTLGFYDCTGCTGISLISNGLFGGSCGGAWKASCGNLQVPVPPIVTGPKLACTEFCVAGRRASGFTPCCPCGKCHVVCVIRGYVKCKVGSNFCIMFSPFGGCGFCCKAFSHSRPAIKSRLIQLAAQARLSPMVCPCPAANYSFGTDQNSFLSPSNQVRLLLWQPVQ
ncbi:MAG TPA: hypothetical protein VGO93_32100 [Candidatus Xenobia bacterium]|jgi:hypothetical protein